MQFKLLNFHRMFANFASSLVGGFIPLIIYNESQNLVYAAAYLAVLNLLILLFNVALKKQFIKRPQVLLLFRIVTLTVYAVSVVMLSYNFIVALIVLTIFQALDLSIKSNAPEYVLNYVQKPKKGSNVSGLAMYRIFQNLGIVISYIMGGLVLDYLSTNILIIIAVSIYFISVIPLTIFYFNFNKTKGFNAELVSNASISLNQNSVTNQKGKKLVKSVLWQYGIMYLIFGTLDMIPTFFNIFTFLEFGEFAYAGYFSAAYTLIKIFISYLTTSLSKTKDLMIPSIIALVVAGASTILIPLVGSIWISFMLYILIGACYEMFFIFILDRMIIKTRILGVSNKAVFVRQSVANCGKVGICLFGLLPVLWPLFAVVGTGLVACGIIMPKTEENTRLKLIDYLEGR